MARKFVTQTRQTTDEMFDSLVKNAIDFVDSAFDDLDKRSKNSIVDFYTAIELFLKARLMHEHWTLIVTRPELANIDSFQVGDFHSVFLNESAKRIANILKEKIDNRILDKFQALGEHRNQIVHFSHTGFSEIGKAKVVVEQWESWHYIYHLITTQWKEIYKPYFPEINRLNDRMLKQKEFLEVRFDALKKEIDIERHKGKKVFTCSHCEMEAGIEDVKQPWGIDYKCAVCGAEDTEIVIPNDKLPCSDCKKEYQFFDKTIENCPHCDSKVETEKLISECKNKYTEGDDWWEEGAPSIALCHECFYSKPSVFYIGGLWSCVSCFDRGWGAVSCPHCGEFVTGDMDKIKHFACHKCEAETTEMILKDME